jgi:hypothetical protein
VTPSVATAAVINTAFLMMRTPSSLDHSDNAHAAGWLLKIVAARRNESVATVLSHCDGAHEGCLMKLIDKIAEDRPLRYAFAGLAVLLMFGMVMS